MAVAQTKKYKVIAIHKYNKCNMKPRCSFCYQNGVEKSKDTKPREFWYGLIPFFTKLTNQIALGSSGEPFMDIPFVKKFSALCKKNDLICNVTSNGRLLMNLNDRELKETLKNITLLSISFDNYKIKTKKDLKNYIKLVQRVKKLTNTQIGSNLLIDIKMFENRGINFMKLVDNLFKIGCNRIFALSPKNIPCPDILKFKLIYQILSIKHKHFYIDDLTKMILEEGKYSNWNKSCHYAKGFISINETGIITGCSFDLSEQALLKLEKPKDILKIKHIKPQKRFSCPYLNIN